MIYLIGNKYTEIVNESVKLTKMPQEVSNFTREFALKSNNVINVAINGGPGSGKGSFEGVIVKELKKSNATVILVAESARDIIDELKEKNLLGSVLEKGELGTLIENEQHRRREIAKRLENKFNGENIYVIYDRDESNALIYKVFFKHYNFDTEMLDETSFTQELRENTKFKAFVVQLKEDYDISYCLKPVNNEKHYACANPQVEGAKIDSTRSESYKMAKELHKALEIGAKMIFRSKMMVVENTDTLDPSITAEETIIKRASAHVEGMQKMMDLRSSDNAFRNSFKFVS